MKPERNLARVVGEEWLISPTAGDCNDYAVTKRHELLARGWLSRALLLAEVIVPSGEHHLVVVVRTNEADLVLDNLNANCPSWCKTQYCWVRIQTPSAPTAWATVGKASAWDHPLFVDGVLVQAGVRVRPPNVITPKKPVTHR